MAKNQTPGISERYEQEQVEATVFLTDTLVPAIYNADESNHVLLGHIHTQDVVEFLYEYESDPLKVMEPISFEPNALTGAVLRQQIEAQGRNDRHATSDWEYIGHSIDTWTRMRAKLEGYKWPIMEVTRTIHGPPPVANLRQLREYRTTISQEIKSIESEIATLKLEGTRLQTLSHARIQEFMTHLGLTTEEELYSFFKKPVDYRKRNPRLP